MTREDGSKEVTEEVIDGGKKTETKYLLAPGESDAQNRGKLKY